MRGSATGLIEFVNLATMPGQVVEQQVDEAVGRSDWNVSHLALQ